MFKFSDLNNGQNITWLQLIVIAVLVIVIVAYFMQPNAVEEDQTAEIQATLNLYEYPDGRVTLLIPSTSTKHTYKFLRDTTGNGYADVTGLVGFNAWRGGLQTLSKEPLKELIHIKSLYEKLRDKEYHKEKYSL